MDLGLDEMATVAAVCVAAAVAAAVCWMGRDERVFSAVCIMIWTDFLGLFCQRRLLRLPRQPRQPRLFVIVADDFIIFPNAFPIG